MTTGRRLLDGPCDCFLRSISLLGKRSSSSNLPQHFLRSPSGPHVAQLLDSIGERKPEKVWGAYQSLRKSNTLRALPSATFSHVLRALQTRTNLRLIKSSEARKEKLQDLKLLHSRLNRVLEDMRKYGAPLGVTDWNHVLAQTAPLRNEAMLQKHITRMLDSGLKANVTTYSIILNFFVGNVYELSHSKVAGSQPERYKKMNEANLMKALQWFDVMQENQVTPNRQIYESLIIGYAKVGNLASIDKILAEVWGINAQMSLENIPFAANSIVDPDKLSNLVEKVGLHPGDAMWPNGHTLSAIAAAYGHNRDIDNALQLTLIMSRAYGIVIPDAVRSSLIDHASRSSLDLGPSFRTSIPNKVRLKLAEEPSLTQFLPLTLLSCVRHELRLSRQDAAESNLRDYWYKSNYTLEARLQCENYLTTILRKHTKFGKHKKVAEIRKTWEDLFRLGQETNPSVSIPLTN